MDVAGEVAGWHQDASMAAGFACAGKGRAADVWGNGVAKLGAREVEVPA
jgi:hypothetical protein